LGLYQKTKKDEKAAGGIAEYDYETRRKKTAKIDCFDQFY